MRILRRRAWVLGALALLPVVACGGDPSGEPNTAPLPAEQAAPVPGRPLVPPETAPPESSQPAPAEDPAAEDPEVGGAEDLADSLPTVSTMAESSAPLPPPEQPGGADGPVDGIEGVVAVPVTSAEHVRYDVEYPTAPPAGGPHLGAWLNCGFYTVSVLDELAVHSLEHGAVWVTYRADVGAEALEELEALAAQSSHLLVSPYEAQGSPLVLSAWARQLPLGSLEDPRFDRFLEVYLLDGPTTPEPGAACSGAVGVPPEHPRSVPQQG